MKITPGEGAVASAAPAKASVSTRSQMKVHPISEENVNKLATAAACVLEVADAAVASNNSIMNGITNGVTKAMAGNGLVTDDLGEHYMSSPYVPPSLSKAQEEEQAQRVGRGTAGLWNTSLDDLGKLGVGVTLYFTILKCCVGLFLFMSLLNLPVLVINAMGSRVRYEELVQRPSISQT
jgi:hypothetical protein